MPQTQPTHNPHSYQRAVFAAIVGLAIQLLLTLAMSLLALYAQSPALQAAAWYLLGGVPIWLILTALYYQHRLAIDQALQAQQLSQTDAQATALFAQHDDELSLAKRRLDRIYRWGLTTVSFLVGAYLLAVGTFLFKSAYNDWASNQLIDHAIKQGTHISPLLVVTLVVIFISFVIARYESGMAKVPHWQLLRAGAGYLMGNSLVVGLVFLGSLFANFHNNQVLAYVGLLVPCLITLIGLEILAALILNLYRPRHPQQTPRPAFDSRLLGWLTTPESIADAVSDLIHYQFGIQVSRSWFYKLLSRAIIPLIIFGLCTLFLISSLVIVAPHEQALVSRFGAIHRKPLGPGLHVKWPWPISTTQKYPVGRVQQVMVGSTNHQDDLTKPILWTNKHAQDEQYLLTAPTPLPDQSHSIARDTPARSATGWSLVGAQIIVQYRVADLVQFLSTAQQPKAAVSAIAQHAVNAYFLRHDIDTLMGPGRIHTADQLHQQIQADVDTMQLGLEVVFVGLVAIHPPADQGVAAAFLEQIDALHQQRSSIEQARLQAIQTLTSVAGSPQKATQIDRLILEQQQLKTQSINTQPYTQSEDSQQQINSLQIKIDTLIAGASGQAAQLISQARAQRWQHLLTERAKAHRFQAQLLSYRHAPAYYRAQLHLSTLSQTLTNARKYILANTQTTQPVFRLDLKDDRSTIDSIFEPTQ